MTDNVYFFPVFYKLVQDSAALFQPHGSRVWPRGGRTHSRGSLASPAGVCSFILSTPICHIYQNLQCIPSVNVAGRSWRFPFHMLVCIMLWKFKVLTVLKPWRCKTISLCSTTSSTGCKTLNLAKFKVESYMSFVVNHMHCTELRGNKSK